MQINKEFLKSLNPCTDRYEHFLKHNASFDGSLSDFMELPNVNYDDKIWVAEKVLTKNQAVSWSILCAESVVHIFEDKHPDDKRFRDCIRYLKTVKDFNSLTDTEREEIYKHRDIIRDYYASYASYAAYYAVRAARYALYVAAYNATTDAALAANHATSAVSYATLAAFHATADAGEDADGARNNQRELNIQFLRMACSL